MANDKRTIELTHEQIDLLVNSLLIAANSYYDQFDLMKNFKCEPNEVRLYWYDKGNKISDLASDIKNGNFDS